MTEHQHGMGLSAEVTARQSLKAYLKKKYRVVQLAAIDANNWMAMIILPGDESLRYRCTDGIIVDEATVGD